LKVSVQDGKACEKILTIEVGEPEVQKEYAEFYKAIEPQAKIPGFRPGKAPRHVVVMHYQSQARERVLKHLISESYKWALQEKALDPVTLPKIEEVDFKENRLSYRAVIEVRPKIRLSRVSGLTAKKEKPEVTPTEIERNLKHVQESLAQYRAVEDRPVALGDFVIADYVCFVEGKEVEKRSDDWFEIREDEFIKGFSVQLVGVRPGEEKEIRVTFPQNMVNKALAGKPATFKLRLKEIKSKILPTLSDELAREAGEYQTLDELKQKIHQNLMQAKEREKEIEFENLLLEELMKHNRFELPQGLVERRLQYLLEQAREDFKKRGAPEEEFEKRKENLRTELLEEAKRQIQLAFLLDEIAVRENITVAEEDFKKKLEQIANRGRLSVDKVEKYYSDHEEARETLKEQIRNEKTIEFVKKHAKEK
jgi:trigger factor